MNNKLVTLAPLIGLSFLLASPLLLAASDNISKVNGSIRVESGRQVGSVETVNGSIRIEDSVQARGVETVSGSIDIGSNATVGGVETVNGDIKLASNAKADSLETVNGELRLDDRVQIRGDATSVNGDINLGKGAQVGGALENVNGDIELDAARVGRGITTTNGDIDIGAGSQVDGGIVVEKTSYNWFSSKRKPKVTIGPDAVVNGTLHFKREVELHVSERATVGKIVGATPIKE